MSAFFMEHLVMYESGQYVQSLANYSYLTQRGAKLLSFFYLDLCTEHF
jgi:hypothetical protein